MRSWIAALALVSAAGECGAWQTVATAPLREASSARAATGISKMSCQLTPMPRRQALGLLVLAPAAANAAIPSMSEYEVGSGSVVRPQGAAETGGQKPKKFTKPVDSETMSAAVGEVQELLQSFEPLIDKQAWDNIRGSLQSQPVSGKFVKPDTPSILFTPFVLGSDAKLMQVAGVDKKKASSVEKARKETALALNELVDFAFTNRVIFFNEEDKKSVADLAEKNLEVDLEEAKGILQRAQEKLDVMASLLGA